QTEVQGVVITKTYTLTEREYHLGLEVTLERKKGASGEVKFRYQLLGAHGLPVEGKWYTGTFRNALIALERGGSITRDLQELKEISVKGGGNLVTKQPGHVIRYAGVAVQFFASVIVVSKDQDEDDFLRQARPTLETALFKGRVKSVAGNLSGFVLTAEDG